MNSKLTIPEIGTARLITRKTLSAAIAALALISVAVPGIARAQETASTTGTIRVCKMIVGQDGGVATTSAGLPSATFSILIGHKDSNTAATTTLEIVTFKSDTYAPNTRLISTTTNDAECRVSDDLSDLPLDAGTSSYVYGEEAIDGSGWDAPKYHDTYDNDSVATSTFRTYKRFGSVNADGALVLGTTTPERTLIILNTVSSDWKTDNDNDTDGSTSSISSGGLRLSDETVAEVVSGTVMVEWDTNRDATTQVVFGTRSVRNADLGDEDENFGYEKATVELKEPRSTTHAIAVSGLVPGETYYMRPVSRQGDRVALGDEIEFTVSEAGTHTPTAGAYLNSYLRLGQDNDPAEVRKLQSFLRDIEDYGWVEVNGVFDPATHAAVMSFQQRYAKDILTPWGYAPNQATGYVYILTKKKVNEIYSGATLALTAAEERELSQFRASMQGPMTGGSAAPATGGTQNGGAVTAPVTNGPAAATSTATSTGGVIIDETEGAGTSTGTSTGFLSKGKLGNMVAAVFALPATGTDKTRCVFNILIILAIIYIITSILVPNDEAATGMTSDRIATRKLMFYLAGTIIAIAFALFFDMYCLVAPLLIALVILIIMLIVRRMGRKNGATVTASPVAPGSSSAAKPMIAEKKVEETKTVETPSATTVTTERTEEKK